jgi:predicted Zn-dependent protease
MPHRAALPILFLGLALLGCGATHSLPQPSTREVAAARSTIAGAPGISRQAQPLPDAAVARVAQRIATAGAPLCREYLGGPCAFQVGIDPASEPNAYASGQNQVAVTRGMLSILENEDELAAVMGHEFAHHLANHIQRASARTQLGGLAGSLAGVLLGTQLGATDPSSWAEQGGQVGAGVGRLAYSVEEEREADYLGAFLVARAGYDLDRAGGIWVRLTKAGGQDTTTLLSTHPAGPERLAAWKRTVEEIRGKPDPLPRRVD